MYVAIDRSSVVTSLVVVVVVVVVVDSDVILLHIVHTVSILIVRLNGKLPICSCSRRMWRLGKGIETRRTRGENRDVILVMTQASPDISTNG